MPGIFPSALLIIDAFSSHHSLLSYYYLFTDEDMKCGEVNQLA